MLPELNLSQLPQQVADVARVLRVSATRRSGLCCGRLATDLQFVVGNLSVVSVDLRPPKSEHVLRSCSFFVENGSCLSRDCRVGFVIRRKAANEVEGLKKEEYCLARVNFRDSTVVGDEEVTESMPIVRINSIMRPSQPREGGKCAEYCKTGYFSDRKI